MRLPVLCSFVLATSPAAASAQGRVLDYGPSGGLTYFTDRMFVSGSGADSRAAIGTEFLVRRRDDLGRWHIVSHASRAESGARP